MADILSFAEARERKRQKDFEYFASVMMDEANHGNACLDCDVDEPTYVAPKPKKAVTISLIYSRKD